MAEVEEMAEEMAEDMAEVEEMAEEMAEGMDDYAGREIFEEMYRARRENKVLVEE